MGTWDKQPYTTRNMYDKDQVRVRFLGEAKRLITAGVAKSYSKLAEGCNLQPYHFSDIRQVRTDVSLQVLVNFVTAYRQHGVSYGYILDGQREKPVVPAGAIEKVERAREEIEATLKLLKNT